MGYLHCSKKEDELTSYIVSDDVSAIFSPSRGWGGIIKPAVMAQISGKRYRTFLNQMMTTDNNTKYMVPYYGCCAIV